MINSCHFRKVHHVGVAIWVFILKLIHYPRMANMSTTQRHYLLPQPSSKLKIRGTKIVSNHTMRIIYISGTYFYLQYFIPKRNIEERYNYKYRPSDSQTCCILWDTYLGTYLCIEISQRVKTKQCLYYNVDVSYTAHS